MISKFIPESGLDYSLTLTFEEGSEWTIGRDPAESQLVINEPSIAPLHVLIRKTDQGFSVESLTDEFLTTINHEPFESPYTLQDNDTIQLGDLSFRFVQESHEKADLDESKAHDSPEDEVIEESPLLADIHFGVGEQGRWLLKVIGGPNSGAEFFMHTGHEYILGTDPQTSDVIFQDNSVSRQHARISISEEDHIEIEDLKSRNGIFIKNHKVNDKESLPPSTTVTIGTSSFIVYDREGNMNTIISPLLPSIVKGLQQEQKADPSLESPDSPKNESEPAQVTEPPPSQADRILLILGLSLLIFAIGYGAYTLFFNEPVVVEQQEAPEILIHRVLSAYPQVQYAYNPSNGKLALFGHVFSPADKQELLYSLSSSKQIKSIETEGLIVDEHVWKEFNSVLSNSKQWKQISIHAPDAGIFIVSGSLKTRKEADELKDYLRINFPYNDLLENKVVVEEDLLSKINALLINSGLRGITTKYSNGDLIFSGHLTNDQPPVLQKIIEEAQQIPGVRTTINQSTTAAPAEIGITDISNRYEVTGYSQLGNNRYSVIIEGRILQDGDTLDGMLIDRITGNAIFLSKGDRQFRINYK